MNGTKNITVLLVEDHDIVRTGLRLALEQSGEIKVIGEAVDGESAVKKLLELHPDIVLMDIGLPGMNGLEATWKIKQAAPATRILMLTSHDSDDDILAALGAGADGFCLKHISIDKLREAIKAVLAGSLWLDSGVSHRVNKVATSIMQNPRGKQSIIFERQLEIMRLVEDKENTLNTENLFGDKYLIESVISEGGMGIVYEAMHIELNKKVAIKVLKNERAVDRKLIRWFQQEAKSTSSLSHPNIISVFDFGISTSGRPYLVMDYVDGINLDQVIMADGPLELSRFLRIFEQVCDGMSDAHAHEIIHCDLKPSNIMLVHPGTTDEVRIVDFGLSKVVPRSSNIQLQMTESHEVAGSPLYMSPEQCLGHKLDSRSDIYALGSVMYEAITGFQLFDTASPFETFSCQLRETPKDFNSLLPNNSIPKALESIIFKALNKAPELRFQSVAELKVQLCQVF